MGILDPFSCAFVEVAVYNILCKNIPKFQGESKTAYTPMLLNKQFSMYNDFFATKTNTRFKVEYKTFVNNFTEIKGNINTLKTGNFYRGIIEELGIKTSTLPDQLQDLLRGH